MTLDLQALLRQLFKTAETLWTNTGLRPDQYAQPALALNALRQMEAKFLLVNAELKPTSSGRLKPSPAAYQANGAMFISEIARFSRLLAPPEIKGDAYGLIFEYFIRESALAFMQKGSEYFTPASIAKLIVEVIEPYHGAILDPGFSSGVVQNLSDPDAVVARPMRAEAEVQRALAGPVDIRSTWVNEGSWPVLGRKPARRGVRARPHHAMHGG